MTNQGITDVLMAYGAYMLTQEELKETKSKKRPSCRVNPYLAQRNVKGRFARDFEDMTANRKVFSENFHMDLASFEELLSMVEPHLLPKRNVRPDAISPKQKLAVVLEYLASGSLPRHLASVYRISKQHLGTIIESVCDAICIALKLQMCTLSKTEFVEIANGFNSRWQFPNCLGAMDGKHIALKSPAKSGSIFYNYKGFHSLVLFAVADWKYKFTYLDIGAYGSESDANIFSCSEFGKKVLCDGLDFPENATINDEKFPFYFIGDDAFPLCKRILKPYGGKKHLSTEEIIFNYRLSRARRCVENAFGILCSKWLCLVTACCFLHNFLLEKTPMYCSATFADSVSTDGDLIEGDWRVQLCNVENSLSRESVMEAFKGRQCDVGKTIRDKLKTFLNSPEGAVDWQRRATFQNNT